MPDPKDSPGFFRKVVRFVANPATDWSDLNARSDPARETELEKSEWKAMVERKRRNDFVRKREFDMLRRVRREGLSAEQLAELEGGVSRIDEADARDSTGARADRAVKEKIDEIEQQIAKEGGFSSTRRTAPGAFTTRPAGLAAAGGAVAPPAAPSVQARPSAAGELAAPFPEPFPEPVAEPIASASPPPFGLGPSDAAFGAALAVEVSEGVHDPELDEAVIAFANADFEPCEQALLQLTGPGGGREQHAETWLTLFDLYRATGQQHKFDSLAVDYAQQFGWSAPQWFSLPRLVAEASAEPGPRARFGTEVGWVCPAVVDADAVARLRSQTLQMPLPWVFDFSALTAVEAEAASRLAELFRQWCDEPLEMRWLSGERLFQALAEAAPTGVRDVDPALWMLRLEALRMVNRPDRFDEAAIDYCVTYEVSPPSWERPRCSVRVSGAGTTTQSPALLKVSEVSRTWVESMPGEEAPPMQVASVELSGQLVGDIGPTIEKMNAELGGATLVNVACQRLIRVDFLAAGDLLNWVLRLRGENRSVVFNEAHRLVAMFFGAMGISEHAKVKVRVV